MSEQIGEQPRRRPTAKEMETILQQAAREAVLNHARLGQSVVTMRDGEVVWLSPEEILAMYGGSAA